MAQLGCMLLTTPGGFVNPFHGEPLPVKWVVGVNDICTESFVNPFNL
jgi:hypothetical protein